jgi:putative transposase
MLIGIFYSILVRTSHLDLSTLKLTNNMAKTEHYHTKFEAGNFYHVYNRTIDKKPMFKNRGNFEFFLKRYLTYLDPYVETYAYCLLGNHFHFLIRIRDLSQCKQDLKEKYGSIENISDHRIVSLQFRKFFQSYSMAFNAQQDRVGTLFQTPFKRAIIDDDSYLINLIYYIHANPRTHGLSKNISQWEWSSLKKIVTNQETFINKDLVIDWYGGLSNLIAFHEENQKIIFNEKYHFNQE